MRLILLGPPGVGKGTEAEILKEHYQIPHISTGNIFRELFQQETEIGKIAKSFIEKGQLVPDDITNEIVRQRLYRDDVKYGFMFDGYPRNVEQAEALDKVLAELGIKLTAVINIQADDELILSRISGRRVCASCGAVYHTKNKQPKVAGVCDQCGGKLIHRDDDKEETVKNRLKIYHDQTAPVVGYYEEKGLLITVDGSTSIGYTNDQIEEALGELK